MEAARDLLRTGREPSLEDVAAAALVSRSTAYRYFASSEALVSEAILDEALGDAVTTIREAAVAHDDEDTRVQATVRADHAVVTAHERAFRLALREWVTPPTPEANTVRRPGNRLSYLRDALSPLEDRLSADDLDRLVHALAMMVGIESIVVLRDVCGLSADDAEDLKCWAARTLLRGATTDAPAAGDAI